MALVKMIRNLPEVKGGKTEGMFPEEAVAELKGKGWKAAEKTSEKTEPVKDKSKDEPKEPVKDKTEADSKKEEKVEKPIKK